jgi:hypothetical protein
VRFGSKADICDAKSHVRFTPISDIECVCPLRGGPPLRCAFFTWVAGLISPAWYCVALVVPAAFLYPCQPIVAKQPPTGPGWGHELKQDGYRLQIHVRDGRVRLYTINGANWSKRYPLMGIATFGCAPWKVSTWRVNLDDDGMDCFAHCHS